MLNMKSSASHELASSIF